MRTLYGFIAAIVFIIGIFLFYVHNVHDDQRRVYAKIASVGGQPISVEQRVWNTGPFWYVKGSQYFEFKYKKDGKVYDGWAWFGLWTSWDMDYKG